MSSLAISDAVNGSAVSGSLNDICALSPLQQAMFADANNGNYAQQALWTCREPLDEEKLKQSWEMLAQRQPILRTVFRRARKQPVQIIRTYLPLSLSVYDFRDQSELEQARHRVIQEELSTPFALGDGPLYRVRVFPLAGGHWQTLLTFHPILLDRQSARLILAEAGAIYHALQNGDVPEEQDSPTIKDFLLWLQRNDSSEASQYWHRVLDGAAGTRFPADEPVSSKSDEARVAISLDESLTSSVKALARQSGVKVITVFQTAWALLLGRWCGTNDVIYGLAMDGRAGTFHGSKHMAGRFAHVLPLRIHLEAGLTLSDVLRSVEQQAAAVDGYGHFPLSEFQARDGGLPSQELFNSVFAERIAGAGAGRDDFELLGGRDGSPADGPRLEVVHGESWQVAVTYPEDRFEPATVQGMAAALEQLLENMTASAQQAACEIEVISSLERTRILGFSQGEILKDEKLWAQLKVSNSAFRTGVYVLDKERRILPVGCWGEIAVTAAAEPEPSDTENYSISSPWISEQTRLWFTGQKGRWTNDGRLQLSGTPETRATTEASDEATVPRTEIEKTIAEVWKEVLGISRAGLKDNFFDLGGYSLTTIQVRSQLSRRLGINVPLKVIFSNQVLEELAQAIAALRPGAAKAFQSIPRLQVREHYPVSQAQRRLWFLHRLDPEDRFYHSADCILLEGALDKMAFEQALQTLGERQEILRTSFRLIADEPVQCISEHTPAMRFHDLSACGQSEQAEQMKALQEEIPQWLSHLETPPVAALLVKLAQDKHIFILAIHHILSDEWSGQIVWRDLMELYSAACQKRAPQLPPIRARYADFATWQKERIANGQLAESERYWLNRLQGPLPKLKLRPPHDQDQQQAADLFTEETESGPQLTALLTSLGQAEDATPFMVRLAVFKAFLSRLTGQADTLVGTTTAGRDHPDLEALVGLFVNVVALRTHLDGDPKLADIVKRVKQTCIEAYVHEEYPFDLLVQRLAPVRDGRQLPLLEAFFADMPDMKAQVIEGVRFTPVDVNQSMAAGNAGRKLPVPMGMMCQETGAGNLTWRFLFRPDSFSPESARRLVRQFDAFLSSLVEHPEASLSETNIAVGKLQHLGDRQEYPLSLNQRDMWFQGQIHKESGLNNLSAVVSLSGPLNVELFRQALQAVVDRHDTLRTVFIERHGVPWQRVLATVPVVLPVVDLAAHGEEEQAVLIQERQAEVIGATFDLASGPLFRAELLRLYANKHVLTFAFSHLILDGIYMADLFEQAASVYAMLLEGKPAVLPPLELQYADFAAWQDERLAQGLLEQHQSYWQEQLQPPLPAMILPSDNDVRSVHSFQLRLTQWQVRDDVFQALKGFRKRYRTTLFRTVLAAFQVLLRKIVGEKELLLGIPLSMLPAHVSQILGFFAHAVPIRTHVDDEQPFTEVLNEVNQAISRAQEHLEYPLCEAVRGLQISRDPHRPLFPVVVSQNKDLDLAVGDLRLRMDLRPMHAGVYHLWLTVIESRQALHLGLYYNREILEGPSLAMIQECFNELLSQVAVSPEVPIANLGIVSAAEQEKLKTLAGGISSFAEQGKGIVARIEEQARRKPQATAASCGSAKLNYEQLNQNANRMARWLRSQGIGRESRVGIFGNRSLEMLTTLLAVLKAGAAFVPLDPDHPDARLRSIIKKTGLSALATSADLISRSQEMADAMSRPPLVICWDELPYPADAPSPATWVRQSGFNLDNGTRLNDLAYVCYTSGSTGVPKGAMVEHRGMLNHLLAKVNLLKLDEHSVVAQNASHCFDISIWQFFAALLVGGRIVIYPAAALLHRGSMLQLVDDDAITVLETVPSLLETMLADSSPELTLSRLRHMISNAELLPVALCQRWKQRFPHVALINTYGATECSDDTAHHVVGAITEKTVRIPVGRSIAGSHHYLLDHDLQTVPAGCTGQIAIAGEAVGRGYLADPATTARTFVPDPFRPNGCRLYLTGDLGRWNSAGELEFLGRTDNQIKFHGHRVELGEIEAALLRLPGVRQAAVILSEADQGQKLLAYWVGEAGLNSGKLRDHARQELPPYMVPSAFLQMTTLPLTRNGKLDRRALPKPADTQNSDFVPPRDEVEFKLVKLWRSELDVAALGVFDNFFERGGHSLKAVSLLNRVQTEFHITLPLRTLFDHQTIDSLARVIRDSRQDSAQPKPALGGLISLQRGPTDPPAPPLFLIHPHAGTVFCYQALAAALGDRAPIFGIQCRGLEEGEQPLRSIPAMAAEYILDIFQAQKQGPFHIAGWSLGGVIAFEIARQLEAGGHKVAFLGVLDTAIPSSTGGALAQQLPDFKDTDLDDLGSHRSMALFARWFFPAEERQLENLSDSQIVDALRDKAQRAGMFPPHGSEVMFKRFVAVAITSGLAFYQYRPAAPVQTDVVLFRAAQSLVDDAQWWAPWTRGQVQTVPVDGTHHDMVFPPAVHTLASALRKYLSVAPETRSDRR